MHVDIAALTSKGQFTIPGIPRLAPAFRRFKNGYGLRWRAFASETHQTAGSPGLPAGNPATSET